MNQGDREHSRHSCSLQDHAEVDAVGIIIHFASNVQFLSTQAEGPTLESALC
jgi:hypothetical protein